MIADGDEIEDNDMDLTSASIPDDKDDIIESNRSFSITDLFLSSSVT